PVLGAFALRPTAGGVAAGSADLESFLDGVLDHAASQFTLHERSRYWLARTYREEKFSATLGASAFLDAPPADTLVLLGYVRSSAHREWIRQTRLYNLRADQRVGAVRVGSRELTCDFVLMYDG